MLTNYLDNKMRKSASPFKSIMIIWPILLFSQVAYLYGYYHLANNKQPDFKLAASLITAWTQTDSFLDDVYTFNIRGIESSLEAFLVAYHDSDIDAHICIRVTINSLAFDNRDTTEHCTQGASVTLLTANASNLDLRTGSVPIQVASKSLAVVDFFISKGNRTLFNSPVWVVILAIMLSIGAFLLHCWLCRIDEPMAQKELDKSTGKRSETEQNLANIHKVVNNNKRYFAINDDIVVVVYKHPYSELIYKTGLSNKIKCSLSDLEHSFSLPLVRLNRSTLVNRDILANGECSDIKSLKEGYVVKLNIKQRTLDIKVSNHYKNNLVDTISGGKSL
ncbi:hypothetical protein FCU94_09560 [Vibrio sp. JPW-9-11-11]|uniref:hypothetical protein n=1 Tax=Vibrio sp. JPW-9-11-11 TaxID=1416532 RepID=UPI0015943229|nr:hypothetical protein [Vibrio sp. JPW-9-11-11]NVD07156.1 hypothetical protein [Vibrio sp. JPW-9-11-11]